MDAKTGTVIKLSQWDALLLESLKSYGWTDEQLIRKVHAGDFPEDTSPFQFDYSVLNALASSDAELFAQAVTEGYQIKYNTIRGIHSWLKVAFKQEAELLLESGSEAVHAWLTNDEADRLAAVLSYGWSLSRLDGAAPHASDAAGRDAYRIYPAAD
ncbi:hypothetical protein SAMN04487969_12649 [Paenibacillus algorifonticola]|uniref:Uncharacterized protein n=1 Tax=Paenibacillus algorifonticola TaxID=684063 RepID=A0A1I2HVQ8_9BACL|nr:hypothetical protein [Paenibacillus algorifonticola]SFF32816.1 hypothetical protein SAMN04487969_12649 [Paenibacillus algorifonticola]